MQPAAALGNDTGSTVRLIKGMGAASDQNNASGTVNNEAFWRKKVQEVPVNQVWWHLSKFDESCNSLVVV